MRLLVLHALKVRHVLIGNIV